MAVCTCKQQLSIRQNILIARQEFENRPWKFSENFYEYFHGKMIMAYRVQVTEEELIEHLIDGITDAGLRDEVC